MILYHGTNTDIKAIDLTKGLRHKDFGKGFYLTPEKVTAERMAKKKARLFGEWLHSLRMNWTMKPSIPI